MIKTERPSFSFSINSRPVIKFKGQKTYVSTGDSDDMDNGELVTYSNRPSRANVQPKIGDVIFAKMANTSKTFLVDDRLSKMIFSTGFFDISSDKFENRFLYYLIQSDEFDGYKNAYSEGTTQVSITDKRLKKICVSYETDINRQKLIALSLDSKTELINQCITNLQTQVKLLSDYLSSFVVKTLIGDKLNRIFDKVLSRDDSFTPEIKKVSLLIKAIKVGPFGSDLSGADVLENDTGYPIFDQRCVLDENFNCFRTFVSKDKFNQMRSFRVHKNDFLITTRGTIGRAAICDSDIIGVLHPCLMRITFINPIWSDYFYYLFNYTSVLLTEIRLLSSQTTIEALYSYNFLRLYVPNLSLPDLTVKINNVREMVTKINLVIQIKKQKINSLIQLKNSLIYEYVSGKKEVA